MQLIKKNILPLLIFALLAVLIPAMTWFGSLELKYSFMVLGGILGAATCVVCLTNYRLGYYIVITVCFTIRLVERMAGAEFPVGVIQDVLLGCTLMGSIFSRRRDETIKVPLLRDPLIIVFCIYGAYLLLQFLNPNAITTGGTQLFTRVYLRNMILLVLSIKMINSMEDLRNFFKFWITLCTLAAFYACIQDWVGLLPFERKYIALYPDKFKTVVLLTGTRAFSFLSDPAVLGIIMACCTAIIAPLLTASGKTISAGRKLMLFAALILQILALGYSGTRTGYVMVPMGLLIFFLANLHNRNTIIGAMIFGLAFLAILFGPFHSNPTIVRVRTAFTGSKSDESLNVRDVNRHRIQPYIYKHPIGGGLMTAGVEGEKYNPGHPLAGFPPDSGYLRTALEQGWIGLILVCLYLYMILSYAVKNYFRAREQIDKLLLIGVAGALFAGVVGQYAQETTGLFESAIMVYAFAGISIKVKYLLSTNTKAT